MIKPARGTIFLSMESLLQALLEPLVENHISGKYANVSDTNVVLKECRRQ